nr:MAG TPA: hypothetical protein [Caudoviricetes sp.]
MSNQFGKPLSSVIESKQDTGQCNQNQDICNCNNSVQTH